MQQSSLHNSLSPIGLGTYRFSIRSKEHYQVLLYALEKGINLIDTSSNYTDGDSERLIGKVLADHPEFDPFIVTKAGYIQGQNLRLVETLQQSGKAIDDLVDISPELKHSIHPDFLAVQIEQSLERLGRSKLDCFLLHNPEYFFELMEEDEAKNNQDEYYHRIAKAFAFLEEQVKIGKIGSYGISSNHFPYSLNMGKRTDLERVYQLATQVSSKHNFRFVQFPYNLVENEAERVLFGDQSLIQIAKKLNLTTLSNRPLNAFSHDGLTRLASYEFFDQDLDEKDCQDIYDVCFNLINKKWKSQGGDEDGVLGDLPLMRQFRDLWKNLPTPDAVDQVFQGHFFPFLIQIWGGNGLSSDEAKPFFLLYDAAMLLARRQMTEKARQFEKQMISNKIFSANDERPIALKACEYYLNQGIDHVLVGLRKKQYVDQILPLL